MSEEVTKVPGAEDETTKTFSADYVKALREEAKEHRMARKAAEADALALKVRLKGFLGLKETDDITDDTLTSYQKAQEKKAAAVITEANKRLIRAEIRALEGYDSKLVERLLDWSKIQVTDDREVAGLKEAVEELIKEFPQIKLTPQSAGGVNPPAGSLTPVEVLERDHAKAVAEGRILDAVALKNELWRRKNAK